MQGDFSFLIVKRFQTSFKKPALVLHVLHFIGNFFYKTCASLARAAFTRDFLYNQKGRRSIAGMAQQLESAPFPRIRSHSHPPNLTFGGRGGGGGRQRMWGKRGRFELLSHPRYRPPTLLVVSESESEVKWSEVIFGSLIFFNFRYIMGGVGGNNNIGIKKCTTIFLWEWSSKQVGGLTQKFSKTPCWREFLKKWCPTCRS